MSGSYGTYVPIELSEEFLKYLKSLEVGKSENFNGQSPCSKIYRVNATAWSISDGPDTRGVRIDTEKMMATNNLKADEDWGKGENTPQKSEKFLGEALCLINAHHLLKQAINSDDANAASASP